MDTRYPLSCCDDTYTNMRFSLLVGLQFDQALCPRRLEASLNTLLRSDENWLKLAGRLRMNELKQLEIRVPGCFPPGTDAVRFSAHEYLHSLASHPLAKYLARSDHKIQIVADNEKCRPFYQSARAPTNLKAYLQANIPVLTVHVTRFSDATFIGILIPHVVADAVSLGLLFHAWADVLKGKPAPQLVSYKEDRLAQVISETRIDNDPGIVAGYAVGWWQELVYIFWILVGILLHLRVVSCTMYVPAEAVRKWRDESSAELRGNWISEGDILAAWLIQHRLPDLRRDVTAWIVADVRQRLPSVPANYFGNAALPLIFPLLDRGRTSTARIAESIRYSIATQTTAEQLAKELTYITNYRKTTGRDGMLAVPGGEPFVISNWCRAGFLSVDFQGALPEPEKPRNKSAARPLLPISAAHLSHANLLPTRFFAWVVGKDTKGGYVVQCQVPRAHFERFKKAVLASA